MDMYETAIASRLERLFKEFDKSFQYMIETVMTINHGCPSHTETLSCCTTWYQKINQR